MNSWAQESSQQRRTSERRRLKMLRKFDQYKIANPYLYRRKDHSIPDEISRQLKKIDYLSWTSISMLKLPFLYLDPANNEIILEKMVGALEDQQKRFASLFGQSLLDYKQVDAQEYSLSDNPQANPSQGSEAIQTKDEMPVPLHIYDYGRDHIEQNFFDLEFKNIEGPDLVEVEKDLNERCKDGNQILGEDYEKYFMN